MEIVTIIIGILGIIRNIENRVLLLISMELIIIGLFLLAIKYGMYSDDLLGIIIGFIIITLGSSESAIGLSIIIKSNK
jgi:NADH:ubiquinone oxidoreductase subunit K